MKTRYFAIVLSFLALGTQDAQAEAYGSGWYGEAQVVVLHEDNISRSFRREDQVSELISSFSIGGGYSRKIGSKSQLILSGYLNYSDHDEFDDLDNLATSLGASLTYQPGSGYGAFWIGLSSRATWLTYDDNEAREGVFMDLDLNLNRRFSTSLVGRIGYRYLDMVHVDLSDAKELAYAAFDTAGHEVYLGVDKEVYPSVFAFAEYGYRHGGLTSSVSIGDGYVDVDYEAQTLDPVFDDCDPAMPTCDERYAYRVVSDMQHLDIGIAFPLRSVNLDVTASYFDAEAEVGGTRHKDWTVRVGVVWNF